MSPVIDLIEYLGSWKPGDLAIYSDFGLRSLFIVEVQPWPERRGDRFGTLVAGPLYLPPVIHDWREGSVRAKIKDTSLVEWDFPWRDRPLEPWKQVEAVHYYHYSNLYSTIYDLMRHEAKILRSDILQRMVSDLMDDPGWQVLRKYNLASASP